MYVLIIKPPRWRRGRAFVFCFLSYADVLHRIIKLIFFYKIKKSQSDYIFYFVASKIQKYVQFRDIQKSSQTKTESSLHKQENCVFHCKRRYYFICQRGHWPS